ncbi:MAG: MarR family transcriptional regulator [Verrucomicrobiaceae bacterium]|nr:MAG: MarR family transcriptional regulator [Verrucomicrobiaceae bacterium]
MARYFVKLTTVTKTDYEKLAAFRYELRKFLHFSEQAAKQHGLATKQYLAMLAIEGFPGRNEVTMNELSQRLQIAAHTAVELTDRLEAAGLAKRTPSTGDKRQVLVRLTRLGRSKLEKLAGLHKQELASKGALLLKELTRILHP